MIISNNTTVELLAKQAKQEFVYAHSYMAWAHMVYKTRFSNIAEFFWKQSQEELLHAHKLSKLLAQGTSYFPKHFKLEEIDLDVSECLHEVDKNKSVYSGDAVISYVFRQALLGERTNLNNLSTLCKHMEESIDSYGVSTLVSELLVEQVKEVNTMTDLYSQAVYAINYGNLIEFDNKFTNL